MIIYLSGITDRLLIERDINFEVVCPNIMLSYLYVHKWLHKVTRLKNCNVFLDSSAFAAYNSKTPIDIYKYIEFIQTSQSLFSTYSNLDVIYDTEGTLKNQEIMEAEGLTPVPVYHFGEDAAVLRYYIERYNYIGIGGTVPIKAKVPLAYELCNLLDDVDTSITKFHVFGYTSFKGIRIFADKIHSVDSSSWAHRTRHSEILQLHGKTLKGFRGMPRYEIAVRNIEVIKALENEVNSGNIFSVVQ